MLNEELDSLKPFSSHKLMQSTPFRDCGRILAKLIHSLQLEHDPLFEVMSHIAISASFTHVCTFTDFLRLPENSGHFHTLVALFPLRCCC